MTVLELRFPAGRFHGTPWGRHVNEGAVEWPPSPWRILRALIATWYWKGRRGGEIRKDTMSALIEALSVLPVFRLPTATTAHTRHYMPYNEGKNEKTTKVFDTFIQVADGASVIVAWDCELNPESLATLKMLAARLGYFGRAESLVEARVLEGVTGIEPNAVPVTEGEKLPDKTEVVRLLAPIKAPEYEKWRVGFQTSNQIPSKASKPAKNGKRPGTSVIPANLFNALHADTGELQVSGWNLPPGAQYVNYIRPENAFSAAAKPPLRGRREVPTVARYAVVSAVPPDITRALSVAERVHDALCSKSGNGRGGVSVFTGLAEDGKPRDGHAHAQIFCEANGERDTITHITIWAQMGFDEDACRALRSLQKVWGHGGHDIRLVLHGIGGPEDFQDCRLFGESKAWRSFTPFVSTRHAKTYRDGRPKMDSNGWQQGSAAHDLLRLLSLNPKWQGGKIRQIGERNLPFLFGGRRIRALQFQTLRRGGLGRKGNDHGGAFIIEFPEVVSGPIAVGYGAHFGLGLFVPVAE